MSVRADSRIGTELAGYRIERLLGRGGMGVVYLAHDPRLERRVALKLLSPSLAEDSEFRARFLRESKLAASLDHQNVVPIFEAGEAEGTLFIAMRYVEGTDLREVLREKGRLEPERTIVLLAQVADALDAAHEHGLIHRDVKPANILLAADEHVYLADFGLTRRAEDPDAGPAAGNSLGTVDYVAPEQIEGGPVDGHADVYSLGCVLYQCLTGQPPYGSDSPMGVLWDHLQAEPPTTRGSDTNLPEAIDPVITQALAKDPGDRCATCHEAIEAARDALGVSAAGAQAPRRRTGAVLVLLALALIAAVATGLVLLTRSESPAPATHPAATRAVTAASVQHIDPATNALVSTARVGGEITQVAAGEGGIWATDDYSGTLTRISPRTGSVTGRALTSGDNIAGGNAYGVAVGLGSVWVLNSASSILSEVDPGTLNGIGFGNPIHPGEFSGRSIAVGRKVWVVASQFCGTPSCEPDTELRWFARDGSNGSATFPPLFVTSMAASNGTLWLAGYADVAARSGSLDAIDESSHRYLSTTGLDFLPTGGLATGAGELWLTAPTEGQLIRIDAGTRRITKRIPVGRSPIAVAVGAGAVWVANYEDGTVSRIDPETNAVVATIEVGPHPDHIAAGEGGVWVAVDPL